MFPERLKELRRRANITQEQLGRELGVSTSTVGMYEQGRRMPDNDMLTRICSRFSVSADYLLRDGAEDVGVMLGDLRARLSACDSLMFNGVPLSAQDAKKVLDAMELGAKFAMYGNDAKNK